MGCETVALYTRIFTAFKPPHCTSCLPLCLKQENHHWWKPCVAETDKGDQKIETADESKEDVKSEEPKAVDTVSEQLEKLNVGTESDGTKTSETNSSSAGDTVASSASS